MKALTIAGVLVLLLAPVARSGVSGDLFQGLIERLDLNRPGLEKIASAAHAGQWREAAELSIEYYSRLASKRIESRPLPERSQARDASGDLALTDRVALQGVRGVLKRLPNGRIDWHDPGPRGDIQWTRFLNRHLHWETLRAAYAATGNIEYARFWETQAIDWLESNSPPSKKSNSPIWDSMEAARRMVDVWPGVFYTFVRCPEVGLEIKIRMLSSVADHARVCTLYHAREGNHLLVEMQALTAIATYFPEFREAPAWMNKAMAALEREMERQVYPDGVQKELANHYQLTSARAFQGALDFARRGGYDPSEALARRVDVMWEQMTLVVKPSGMGPLNNDSDLENAYERVLPIAELKRREDWIGRITGGTRGNASMGIASWASPWAGQIVMRSGWNPSALWVFFDVGPGGINYHHHCDKLHVSLAARGMEFLVDAGRYHYRWDKWRRYFRGARAHNVVLLDGAGPTVSPMSVASPCFESSRLGLDKDWAQGKALFHGLHPSARHRRTVFRHKDEWVLVVDCVDPDRPGRKMEALWHFHPLCEVRFLEVNRIFAKHGQTLLYAVPLGETDWKAELIRGREQGGIQGWYSEVYNKKEPAVAACYKTTINRPVVFGWLFMPGTEGMKEPSVSNWHADGKTVRFELSLNGEARQTHEINLGF